MRRCLRLFTTVVECSTFCLLLLLCARCENCCRSEMAPLSALISCFTMVVSSAISRAGSSNSEFFFASCASRASLVLVACTPCPASPHTKPYQISEGVVWWAESARANRHVRPSQCSIGGVHEGDGAVALLPRAKGGAASPPHMDTIECSRVVERWTEQERGRGWNGRLGRVGGLPIRDARSANSDLSDAETEGPSPLPRPLPATPPPSAAPPPPMSIPPALPPSVCEARRKRAPRRQLREARGRTVASTECVRTSDCVLVSRTGAECC